MEKYFYFSLVTILFSIFTVSQDVVAEEESEFEERKQFIKKAMEEVQDQVRKDIERANDQGLSPLIRVTELRAFGDWDFYYVKNGSIRWDPNNEQTLPPVEVPEGFVTDLTSVPRIFWQILKPEGRYAYAAVVHDYLYWTQERPREEADRIFKFAMEDSKVNPMTVEAIYRAVRIFGNSSWDQNALLKTQGERRFLAQFPEDYTIGWEEWKRQPNVFREE